MITSCLKAVSVVQSLQISMMADDFIKLMCFLVVRQGLLPETFDNSMKIGIIKLRFETH